MRVLITGAGGFIGSHLVADQLKRGRKVTAVDLHVESLASLAADPRLCVVTGDFADDALLDPLLPRHDVCFHLASAHLETGVDETYFWQVNVQGTRKFVERCHQAGIGRFVHCSSVGVFGDIKNPPADEESECHPDIAYEKSKLAGETAVLEYARETDYPVAVIRPAWVYGPNCRRTLKLFKSIKKGRFFFVGNGRTLRHPIYVDDMVEGFEIAATHPQAPGDVFIMAGPQAVTLLELAEEIAQTVGVASPRLKMPETLVWPACYLLEVGFGLLGRPAPFTRRSLKFFTGNTAFNTKRAEEKLGFRPKVELQEGLRRTNTWIRDGHRI